VPIEKKFSRTESMKGIGAVVIRPSVDHCKIYTKQASLICTQYLKAVSVNDFFNADIIFLKLLRFRQEEKEKLKQWIQAAEPKLVVAEPSPFMR